MYITKKKLTMHDEYGQWSGVFSSPVNLNYRLERMG
jgi:hypothetical protein